MKLPEFWKTGVLLLALAGLGSYIWFVERKHEPKAEGEREKVTVLAVDKAKAREISLSTAAGGGDGDLLRLGLVHGEDRDLLALALPLRLLLPLDEPDVGEEPGEDENECARLPELGELHGPIASATR